MIEKQLYRVHARPSNNQKWSMEVQVNHLVVFLAMVSSMVVGAIWYARGDFGAE